jgi:hypothetical protein
MAYQPRWNTRRDEIVAIANRVAAEYPAAWNELKIHGQTSRTFINLLALACQQRMKDLTVGKVTLKAADVGCNGKRGNPRDLSIDVLAFPNDSGAADASGKFAGLELVDMVAGAEGGPGSSPSISWTDVTQATISGGARGAWVQPVGSLKPSPADGDKKPAVPPPATIKPREQFAKEFREVNDFYASAKGLQRPGGMVINGAADIGAMTQWGYDLMTGATPKDVIKAIRASDEWKSKHSGETP